MNLIKVCCDCKKELGRQALPADYGKDSLPAEYKGKDLYSHGFCDKCAEKRLKEINNGKHK